MKSAYDIANESDYATGWFSNKEEHSADYELIQNETLSKLRLSSRKLIKNEPIASGAQKAYLDNILGGKIRVEVDMKNKTNEVKFQKFLDDILDKVDINRLKSLTQINETLVASAFQDGDVLITLPIDKTIKKGIKTYVELIEASRIKTRPGDSKNPLVREGVEYTKDGKLKGYWIKDVLKSNKPLHYVENVDSNYKFFPIFRTDGSVTRRVAWLFSAVTSNRPDQSRQVPVLTPVMTLSRYYNKLLEAILVNNRVAACFSAFVKTSNPAEAKKSLESGSVKGSLVKLEPGKISYLRRDEDIVFASPNKPGDNFDAFIVRLQKIFSMTLRLSFSQLFLDLKDANYSSWRAGSLSAERNINRWRNELTSINTWLVKSFLLEALTKAILVGTLKGIKIVIRYPKYKSIDEEKTSRANRLKLQDGTTTKRIVVEEEGGDIDIVQKEQLAETEFEVELEKEKLVLQKEYSEEYDILFPDNPLNDTGDESNKDGNNDESTEEQKERRKQDGNW